MKKTAYSQCQPYTHSENSHSVLYIKHDWTNSLYKFEKYLLLDGGLGMISTTYVLVW